MFNCRTNQRGLSRGRLNSLQGGNIRRSFSIERKLNSGQLKTVVAVQPSCGLWLAIKVSLRNLWNGRCLVKNGTGHNFLHHFHTGWRPHARRWSNRYGMVRNSGPKTGHPSGTIGHFFYRSKNTIRSGQKGFEHYHRPRLFGSLSALKGKSRFYSKVNWNQNILGGTTLRFGRLCSIPNAG